MQSNHKNLIENMKILTRNVRVKEKDHSLLFRPCLQRQVDQARQQKWTLDAIKSFCLIEKYEKLNKKCKSLKKGSQFIIQTMPTKAS